MSIPLPKVFWPLTIHAGNNSIPILIGATPYTATIASGVYYSAETLRAAVLLALQTAVANSWTVTLSLAFPGSFTIQGSSNFTFRWGTVPASAAAPYLGFFVSNYSSSSLRLDSVFQPPNAWWCPVAVESDTKDTKDRGGDRMTVAMSGQSKRISEVELTRRTVGFQFIDAARTWLASESGTRVNASAERWWSEGAARFRYWPDSAVEGTYGDYFLDEEAIQQWNPVRMFNAPELYRFEIKMRGYVP